MKKRLSSKDVRIAGTEWRSVGREPNVYEAQTPGDLLGVHAELIISALLPGEELRYLLYSPIWDGTWAPFGISAQPASHALVVTDSRFLLSRDLHRDDADPTLSSIPFDQMLWAECGNAHLLGWFSLCYVMENGPGRISVLFESTGVAFFSSALRHYRQALPCRTTPTASCPKTGATWHDLWKCLSKPEAREVRPLVLEEETLMGWFRAGRSWRYRRRFLRTYPECKRPENLLLWTSVGVIHIIHEPVIRPEWPSYGLTVRSIPQQAIRIAEVMPDGALRLTLGRDRSVIQIEVPFDKEYRPQAESLARSVERRPLP